MTLNASTQKKILSMWEGNTKKKGVKDPRAIAEQLAVPRRQVMQFVEEQDLASYSEGSYA